MNIERPKGILKQLCCFNRPLARRGQTLSCLLLCVCLSVCEDGSVAETRATTACDSALLRR